MSLVQVQTRRHPIWPMAVILLGLSLSLSWGILLGIGLFELIEHAI
jgi:hypothetical protein